MHNEQTNEVTNNDKYNIESIFVVTYIGNGYVIVSMKEKSPINKYYPKIGQDTRP